MEKGVRTLHTAGRRASRHGYEPIEGSDAEDTTSTRYPPPPNRSLLHRDEGDDPFKDSGLGHDLDHPFLARSQNEHQRSYASSSHNEPIPLSGGTITPPYSSHGSYSLSSSSGVNSAIANSSQFPLFQQPSPLQPPQSLPSFSAAFGSSGNPSFQTPLPRQSPHHQHTVVTTH